MDKPRLTLKRTAFEKIADTAALFLFIGSIGYLIQQWSLLPDKVPAHYNALGEVDRWGAKGELLILPIIGAIMWIGMTVLEKYPHLHNYMNLNEDNAAFQYKNSQLLLNLLKNQIALLFSFLLVNSIRTANGFESWMGLWFLSGVLIVIFGTIGFFIWRSFRK